MFPRNSDQQAKGCVHLWTGGGVGARLIVPREVKGDRTHGDSAFGKTPSRPLSGLAS